MKTLTQILENANIEIQHYPQFKLSALAQRDLHEANYNECEIIEMTTGKKFLRFKNNNTCYFENVAVTPEIEARFNWLSKSKAQNQPTNLLFMVDRPLTWLDITSNGKYSLD